MKITELLPILSTSLIIAACAGSIVTGPGDPVDHDVPKHKRADSTPHSTVEIVAIYYDQNVNKDSFGLAEPEEWVVLKSNGRMNTKGWWLNAGDKGQDCFLPDTLNGRLYIFTHSGNVPANVTTGGVRKSFGISNTKWLWNNSDHDTATLYDSSGSIVDKLSY
jgi:hypothetical protein